MRKQLGLCFLTAAAMAQASELSVLPSSAELRGQEAHQRFLVESLSGGRSEDVSAGAQWKSSNEAVAKVDAAGMVTPVGDGEATITAEVTGRKSTATVKVTEFNTPFSWSFKNDVLPVMSKVGCNQGACHGALAGKGGFKLTLRGYDPDADYDTLTRQALGRRVSLSAPSHSLILLKPTMAIGHGGGLRIKPDSIEYRIMSEWIAEGAPRPLGSEPTIRGLEVFPKDAVLKPGAEQQLVVRARYSDGNARDVTHWVKFSSSDEGVATVDQEGKVKMAGLGEAAITLWFQSRVAYARVGVPYDFPSNPNAYTSFKKRNYIDEFVVRKLQALNLAPSPEAGDATFLRRASIDATGTLPTSEETETFLADNSPDKRAKLIDRLLERDEFVDYWTYKWSDLLLVSSRKLAPNAMWSFYSWIHDSVKTNKPWNRMVNEIFTSTGDTLDNGALNYFVIHKDPIDLTENATLAFMGQRLTCARCHNHPLEKWTQKQYYEMANLFSRVGLKTGQRQGDVEVFVKTSGEINHPRLLKPLPPAPLDSQPIPLESTEDRRLPFARWLTSPENTMFSRAIVNRVWANFMGRGLVDPVDDLRATNPASNEELFAAVTKDFVDHGYDVKYLIRTIMNSETYQLSSDSNATNQNDSKYYSRYIVRRLPAEVLLDNMAQVTNVPTRFDGYPAGTRAQQLPDVRIKSDFLNSFGRPQRVLCDAAERSQAPSVAQALHLINGDTLNKKLSDPNGFAALSVKLGLSDSRLVDTLFLSAYSRYPTDAEKRPIVDALAKARLENGSAELRADARRKAIEDMMWAMLSSKEFLFNY